MTQLRPYLKKGLIKEQPTSREEIQNLFGIVRREYEESSSGHSEDWQFGIAYNAALKLATILLRASGYRTSGVGHHFTTISLIADFLGPEKQEDCDYLDACRKKRNTLEYDYIGGISSNEVNELREFVARLKKEVIAWLKTNHPDLIE